MNVEDFFNQKATPNLKCPICQTQIGNKKYKVCEHDNGNVFRCFFNQFEKDEKAIIYSLNICYKDWILFAGNWGELSIFKQHTEGHTNLHFSLRDLEIKAYTEEDFKMFLAFS